MLNFAFVKPVRLMYAALVLLTLSACNFPAAKSTATPTDEPTLTLAPTETATSRPTMTLSPKPSITPTRTVTPTETVPVTATLPENLTPTATAYPTVAFVGDQLKQVNLIKQVRDSVGKTWISFIAVSELQPTDTPGTAVPSNNMTEAVYLVSADGATRLKVIDLPASTDRRIYWSPNGMYMAYMVPDGEAPGLYMLDLATATSMRLFAMREFTPRGFPIVPAWSPDSKQITFMLPTPYDFDIFSISPDGSNFINLTENSAYDLWPTWSPDGAYLAFVSDRVQCSSWAPGAAKTCYTESDKIPDGGNLYVLDSINKEIRLLSDRYVGAPPRWINVNRIAFTETKPGDPSAGSSLWWADLRGGSAHPITAPLDPSNTRFAAGDAWSPDGEKVIYQESDTSTRILLRDDAGQELAQNKDLNFPRYLFSAAWSPDGQKIVIGGRNGQCPFGMIIADASLKLTLNTQAGPGVCDPVWSADGRYIAYSGTTRGIGSTVRDGRIDVFVAESSGYGARQLSARLSGQIKLLGWIKGGP